MRGFAEEEADLGSNREASPPAVRRPPAGVREHGHKVRAGSMSMLNEVQSG